MTRAAAWLIDLALRPVVAALNLTVRIGDDALADLGDEDDAF